MTEYKLPKPSICNKHYEFLYYTADTLRTEIAAAEKRGAEAMREKCAVIADNTHPSDWGFIASSIRSIEL